MKCPKGKVYLELEGYCVRRHTRKHDTNKSISKAFNAETHDWIYVPDGRSKPYNDRLLDNMMRTRREFIASGAYDRYQAFKKHFKNVIDKAENGNAVLPVLEELIFDVTRRNAEFLIDQQDYSDITKPANMGLITKPHGSGYMICGITLPNTEGEIEIFELTRLDSQLGAAQIQQ